MKIYFCLFIFLITATFKTWGEDVIFRANAPSSVIKERTFQVSYTVNDADAKNFRGPSFGELEVKFGPSSSVSMSTQIINGKTTTSSSLMFTYVVQASKEGSFNIPPATISVDGKSYTSNALIIKVLPPDKNAPQSSSGNNMSSQGNLGSSASASLNVSSDDLFIRAIASKQTVYEQEAFVLTYKLFSRYESTGIDNSNVKFPDYEGFMTQELDIAASQWQLENVNGKNYKTAVLRQLVMFPQRSGTLTIPAAKIGTVVGVYVPNSSRNPFNIPMGGVQEVKKVLMTPALTINVKSLPDGKPASFSGALGDFTMSSSIFPEQPKTNEGVTVKLIFRGTGNIKLMKNPEIKFPADFETYDPKVDNNFKATSSGMTGSKTIEYLAIPRHPGDFVIPSAEFSYFDLKTQSYKTLKTPEYKLHVEKGSGNAAGSVVSNYTDQESLKLLNRDIRYIKTGDLHIKPRGEFIFGTWPYYLWYLIPLIIAVALFVIFRKQAKENANLALVRTKKANKVAGKRLKKAAVYLKENQKEEFYDEVLKASWGYLSDKLSIPVSELSKDNVESELAGSGVENALIAEFMDILHSCEFARYAPVGDDNSMEKIYRRTTEVINEMESTIKKRNNS
ncbi:MAG: BatD family protein [Candidatus Azobacteroides sp.]|nr:BatD family protein [Candidatus Azobacteroides sp.]